MVSLLKALCYAFLIVLVIQTADSCTFPSDLTGNWITSSRSTLTFTSSTFTPWTVTSQGTFTFTCILNNGTIYVSQSTSFTYIGLTWHAYLCMNITAINTNAFYYHLGSCEVVIKTNSSNKCKLTTERLAKIKTVICDVSSDRDDNNATQAEAGNDQVRIYTSGTVITESLICDSTTDNTGTYDVMVRSGYASQAAGTCPKSIQAYWQYSDDANTCSSGSHLEACGDYTQLTFNYTYCSTRVAYSAGGIMHCILNTTSGGNTYLTLYNADTATDESTTYRYTCMVLTTSGDDVFMTQHPQKCLLSQSSTTISSPGSSFVFQNATPCIPTVVITVTSAGLAIGLGLGISLLFIVVVVVIWFCWKKEISKEKVRGHSDLEVAAEEYVEKVEKVEKDDDLDGDKPPDVLNNVRVTPVSYTGEDGRPTTSGSVHVTMEAGYEGGVERKSADFLVDERPIHMAEYNVVGVHPGADEPLSDFDVSTPVNAFSPKCDVSTPINTVAPQSDISTPVSALAPHKAIVPKGAVALGDGAKSHKPKVNKRNKVPPVDGKLPPIVEDASPRKVTSARGTTPRGHASFRRPFGQRATVGVEESDTGEELPGQVDSRSQGKPKPRRMSRTKKLFSDRTEKKPRNRAFRDVKEMSQDDDEYAPPLTPIKVTRVDINDLTKEDPLKKSPRNQRSDLKVVNMDDDVEKHVSREHFRSHFPEPSYKLTSLDLRGFSPDVRTILHQAPSNRGRGESPKRILRDKTLSDDESPTSVQGDFVDYLRERPYSARSVSTPTRQSRLTYRVERDGMMKTVSDEATSGCNRAYSDVGTRPRRRSRSRSRGRKKCRALCRSRSEVRPTSAPVYAPRSITLDVEEVPREAQGASGKVFAARSLAVDMEEVTEEGDEQSVEKYGTRRGKNVWSTPRKPTKSNVSRPYKDVDRIFRLWVFFAKPIILLTRKFKSSTYMRKQQEVINDEVVEDWSSVNPRSQRRSSNSSPSFRRSPVKIEFGTSNMNRVPEGATLEENPDFPFTAPHRKSWLQEEVPEEHTEVWSKVSNLWKLGQVWLDKANV